MLLGCSRSVQLAQDTGEHSCGVTEAGLRAWQEDSRLVARRLQCNETLRSLTRGALRDNALSIYRENLCAGTGSYQWALERRTEFSVRGERHTYIHYST